MILEDLYWITKVASWCLNSNMTEAPDVPLRTLPRRLACLRTLLIIPSHVSSETTCWSMPRDRQIGDG
ncbi:hypothetical protein VFPPC_15963 [Pochonia chlamydosporia 170]|uniref:Uncharacterized protein n=1 Tax=Pochonia chlamydosporia 170 TaxID=1380566 RepID=A0A179FLM4_METCM|nr:hypothetical protein VFPPC_15963 [Pochonia chlamydosporia 170]OAQ65899.1 hypothetical protein VFPPC_15963 [Pochonia chlamydosporia 170]